MIDDVDAHNLSGEDEPLRQLDVIPARRRVTRWMVVEEHDRRSAGGGGLTENLARMCRARVQGPHGYDGGPNQSVFRVEHHDAELLYRP